MEHEVKIRIAGPEDRDAIGHLLASRVPDLIHHNNQAAALDQRLGSLLQDGWVVLAVNADQPAGLIALDLIQQQVLSGRINPRLLNRRATRGLIAAAEHCALSYGLRRLSLNVRPAGLDFLCALGFNRDPESEETSTTIKLVKSLEADAPDWMRRIFSLSRKLGIPDNYGARRRLKMINDCTRLESIGFDVFDREQFLHPKAAAAWREMRDTAAQAGVVLQLVSAFRGRDYQADLIKTKLDRGQSIEQVLSVSAAPGYSEHHSGRALDLKAPGSAALEEEFAQTSAYRWLKANARYFGFYETLGLNNRHGIIWEPWHWCYHSGRHRRD